MDGIASAISSVWNGILSTTESIWNGITGAISGAINGAYNAGVVLLKLSKDYSTSRLVTAHPIATFQY